MALLQHICHGSCEREQFALHVFAVCEPLLHLNLQLAEVAVSDKVLQVRKL